MEFYEIDELGGQFDNWCAPNPSCLVAMCRTAGFARAELLNVNEFGSSVGCFRHFPPATNPAEPAPKLIACSHSIRLGVDFSTERDDYLSCWFESGAAALGRENVQCRVGAFDAHAVFLAKDGDTWQVNFKLPPGLEPGWHEVRVRTDDSAWSEPSRIAVDVALQVESLEITGACDGTTWKAFEIASPFLSLWVSGVPENGGRDNIRVMVGGRRCQVAHVSPWQPDTPTQLNVLMPHEMSAGEYPVIVTMGQVASDPVSIQVIEAA
jgi:hypothetical protein